MQKMNSYTRIYEVLKDLQWHSAAEIFRSWSSDSRRMREGHTKGWWDYDTKTTRKDGQVKQVFYRLTSVYPAWYEYMESRRRRLEPNGQIVFV